MSVNDVALITIDSVDLNEIPKDRMTAAMARLPGRLYVVQITVTNTSESPVEVVEIGAQVEYEAGRRTLVLNFGDHDIRTGRPLRLRYVSPRRAIGPGERATIEHQLSSPITYTDDDPFADEIEMHEIHIATDVDTIDCVLEHNKLSTETDEFHRARASWAAARSKSEPPRP